VEIEKAANIFRPSFTEKREKGSVSGLDMDMASTGESHPRNSSRCCSIPDQSADPAAARPRFSQGHQESEWKDSSFERALKRTGENVITGKRRKYRLAALPDTICFFQL